MTKRAIALFAVVLLTVVTSARADLVLDWNEILLDAIRLDKTPPPKASRAMAVVHVSIYDAVNGIVGGYRPYHVTATPPAGASAEAAAVAAAHGALVALFPAQQATFDAALVASLATIPDAAAKTAGVSWGESVAQAIVTLRHADHATDVVDHFYPVGANWWQPTPPAFAPALLPNWPKVTPWALASGAQLRSGAPPDPTSAEYTAAFREVKLLGSKASTQRTADQTQIALFWADGPGTATPPGHWLHIAQGLASDHHLSLHDSARLFALLGITVADAAIASWDYKYAYNNWRPLTGIRAADSDGNPATAADPAWEPLITTPPFPSCISGHSTFSGSSARLLALFFGTDAIAYTTTSEGLPGVQRSFPSLSAGAEEAGRSRIYGGIHWQFDNTVGLATGRALAEQVFYNFLRPTEQPSTCHADGTTLCLNGGRFQVRATWSTGAAAGNAHAIDSDSDSGAFWFFDDDNTELTVKVLNACSGFDRYWVFASGLTNVEVVLAVTDTHAGGTRQYFNPLGKVFAPVQDVSAFATCP